MNRDAMVSAIILIGGSIGIGLWYWKLSPDDKLRRLGRSGGGGAGIPPAPAEGPPADLPHFDPNAPPDPWLILPGAPSVTLPPFRPSIHIEPYGGHFFSVGRG